MPENLVENAFGTSLRTDSALQFSVMITAIFEDSKGNFWFGTHGDGLCKYDGEVYTYFTVGNGLPAGTDREIAPGTDWDARRVINGGDQIGSIQEDKEGNIWMKSQDNICRYDGQRFVEISPATEGILSTTLSDEEWQEDLENLWFGIPGEFGVYQFNGSELESLKLPHSDASGRDGVSAIYKDTQGAVWLGTMENGTFRYDGKSFERITNSTTQGISRSVFQDHSGQIWIPQNGKAMFYWKDTSTKLSANRELINFSEEYLKNYPETSNKDLLTGAQCIEQDSNGDIWFGSFGGGLYRYNGTTVTNILPNEDESLSVSKTIYKDRSGRLWFGLGEGSVYECKGDSFVRFDRKL